MSSSISPIESAVDRPSSKRKTRVLLVDDSRLTRRITKNILAEDHELAVVGEAADGIIALEMLTDVARDVVVLDLEMPKMNGLQTLEALRETHAHLPVVVFSVSSRRGAVATIDALLLGANDYVTKPSDTDDFVSTKRCLRDELIPKIKQLVSDTSLKQTRIFANRPIVASRTKVDIIAVAASTGGPTALRHLLTSIAGHCNVPIVIVQHMPPLFTQHLANRLDAIDNIDVLEARDGDLLRPGVAWLAPGGCQMKIAGPPSRVELVTNEEVPFNQCRPSADVLFESVATRHGPNVLAVVLTGMGSDGMNGCEHVRANGGKIVVQDETTSTVWGMPGQVANAGLADRILPLDKIGPEIIRRLDTNRDEN